VDPIPDLPPFQGGLAGYVGYEYGRRLERIPAPRHDDLRLPDVQLGAYDWVVAWDHERGKGWVMVQTDGQMGRWADGRQRLSSVMDRLAKAAPPGGREGPGTSPEIRSGFTRDEYLAAVQRVRQYILAGDVFQANLSQRFEAPCALEPFEFYRRLRDVNPAPFAAYLQGERFAVASASPERFLRVTPDGAVETRPIKGTRPRGPTPDEDQAQMAELMASEKDRAENVMIVDLLRNDLSKVCLPGSVEVPALCTLESHPTVHHLVSTVTGVLEPGRTALDLLRAAFPGGSVTGAPKVRAMEIIAELEPVARGVYCGAMGYVSATGAMDTSIPIRTATLQGGRAWFHAGGGIVADSDPALEFDETLAKAAGIVHALEPAP
jgi:para-aminobenzoate synthetase component I